MQQYIEFRPERTTRPLHTGSLAEAGTSSELLRPIAPADRPALARTRYELPCVRQIRAVG